MQYHDFQNDTTLTCYTYCSIQIRGKVMYLIFVFAKGLLVSWLQSGKAWQARAQQTEKNHSHRNSAVTRQV